MNIPRFNVILYLLTNAAAISCTFDLMLNFMLGFSEKVP